MSRLNDLYNAMETFRKEGLPVTEELEESVNQLEEEIIQKEILPELKRTIEPALRPVRRELVLVVDYLPGLPISVHLSRKRNFAADLPDAKVMTPDPEVEHTSREGYGKRVKPSPASRLVVHFSDGTTIAERTAVDTLYRSVKKIGVEEVRRVVEEQGLILNRVPLISNRRDSKYGSSQRDLGNGWLLMVHSNNLQKKTIIEEISDALGLGLRVELE